MRSINMLSEKDFLLDSSLNGAKNGLELAVTGSKI
jgi:hypothetical protein